jgi:hypothetical protein
LMFVTFVSVGILVMAIIFLGSTNSLSRHTI